MVMQNQGPLLNQDLQLSMPVVSSHEISKIIGDRNQLKLWQLKVCVLSLNILVPCHGTNKKFKAMFVITSYLMS
jgi:hypothetical protein